MYWYHLFFFVIIAELLIPFFLQSPQSWHCLLLHQLNTAHCSLKIVHSTLLPSLSRSTPPTPFPIVIGRTKKSFYFRWLTNSKLIKITLYAFFWVITLRLNFICRRLGTLFHLQRQVPTTPTCLWRWNGQSVPKRRHIKFRRRGITIRKHKTFRTWRKIEIKNIQNKLKFLWNKNDNNMTRNSLISSSK